MGRHQPCRRRLQVCPHPRRRMLPERDDVELALERRWRRGGGPSDLVFSGDCVLLNSKWLMIARYAISVLSDDLCANIVDTQ